MTFFISIKQQIYRQNIKLRDVDIPAMDQELKRIKNCDFSTLDDKLFNDIDKVDTINSTLSNLEQFQKFLVDQIGKFESKAKCHSPQAEVKEVISQNCETLRESIMRAVPEMQSSRAKLVDDLERKSTIFDKKSSRVALSRTSYKEQLSKGKDKNKEWSTTISNLKNEVQDLRSKLILCEKTIKSSHEEIKFAIQRKCEGKIIELMSEVSELKRRNLQLQQQISHSKDKWDSKEATLNSKTVSVEAKPSFQIPFTESKVTSEVKQNNTPTEYQYSLKKPACLEGSSNSKPKLEVNAKPYLPQSLASSIYQKEASEDKYSAMKSFQNSICKSSQGPKQLDFSLKKQIHKIGSLNLQSNSVESETFRDAKNDCSFEQINAERKLFSSIEITSINENQPEMPRPLRRNSAQYQSLSTEGSKTRKALHQLSNQQLGQDFLQKDRNKVSQEIQRQNSSKKSNHDLMRKTKSNFFKKTHSNVENLLEEKLVQDRVLTSSKPQQRSSSKQKLRIFSYI